MTQALLRIWNGYFSSLPLIYLCRSAPILFILCVANTSVATVIDVRTYGALPDDASDDSAAIQSAIDNAPDKSTIYFPRGTYLAAHVKIDNRNGLTLLGDGSTLTILKRSGTYPRIFESTGSADLLVTQLGFDAN